MTVLLPKPKSITAEDVVLSRADWERLVAAVETGEADEDRDDIAAVAAARAEDAAMVAYLEAGRGERVDTAIPVDVVRAELDGAHPIRAWREYRGWSRSVLSAKSGIARAQLHDLETRRLEGQTGPVAHLARALGIPMEFLIEDGV